MKPAKEIQALQDPLVHKGQPEQMDQLILLQAPIQSQPRIQQLIHPLHGLPPELQRITGLPALSIQISQLIMWMLLKHIGALPWARDGLLYPIPL
jgi:hypothetical protein